MKAKVNLKNIFYYMQGNLRYRLFYSRFAFLIRKHIREQIEVRINSMDSICYNEGACKMCGCQTTHLQMSNKACDKPCYPAMLSKGNWEFLKNTGIYFEKDSKIFWAYDKEANKFRIVRG